MRRRTSGRYPKTREERWHVYYGEAHAGIIGIQVGVPFDEETPGPGILTLITEFCCVVICVP